MRLNSLLLFVAVHFVSLFVAGSDCFVSTNFSSSVVSPIEKALIPRQPPPQPEPSGSLDNPKTVTIDCQGIELLCEENCLAILCGKKPDLLQRGETREANDRRTTAGVMKEPFRDPPQLRRINARCHSPEEYPWGSTYEGGEFAGQHSWIMGVPLPLNTPTQGNAVAAAYRSAATNARDWFRLGFQNYNGQFCEAVNRRPPNEEVCNPDMRVPFVFDGLEVDLREFTFERISGPRQKIRYRSVMDILRERWNSDIEDREHRDVNQRQMQDLERRQRIPAQAEDLRQRDIQRQREQEQRDEQLRQQVEALLAQRHQGQPEGVREQPQRDLEQEQRQRDRLIRTQYRRIKQRENTDERAPTTAQTGRERAESLRQAKNAATEVMAARQDKNRNRQQQALANLRDALSRFVRLGGNL